MRAKLLLFPLFVCITLSLSAQNRHVQWTCTAKKTADKTYEVRMTAKIDDSWHIYSQTQPEGAIALSVNIEFSANPLITIVGKPKEIGKLEKSKEATTGITSNEYKVKVTFVQVVKLKAAVKTNIKGAIHFQVCNEEMCLPPMSENFNIALK